MIDVKVVRGVDPLTDNEALKAVRSSPKWTPGRYRGTVIKVSYIITVNFELQSTSGWILSESGEARKFIKED